jgi:putative hydrolase of the HAD superfamily
VSGAIRTLFWDIGGVVLTNGWGKQQRSRVLSRLGADLDAYEALHAKANYYWERGLMTAEAFFDQTVFLPNPKLDLTFPALWKQVCAESKVLHPECLDLLAELKEQGCWRIATLNNESRELNDHRLDAFKLRPLFDYFICSGYVHEMKPRPGIFRTAIEISGYPAERALFIDDKAENCTAAAAEGLNTILFQSPAQLRAALAEFDINLQESAA